MFISVGVSEVDFEEGGASSGVVEDGPDDALDVPLSFGVIEVAIAGRGDSFGFGGAVDSSGFTFPLA